MHLFMHTCIYHVRSFTFDHKYTYAYSDLICKNLEQPHNQIIQYKAL